MNVNYLHLIKSQYLSYNRFDTVDELCQILRKNYYLNLILLFHELTSIIFFYEDVNESVNTGIIEVYVLICELLYTELHHEHKICYNILMFYKFMNKTPAHFYIVTRINKYIQCVFAYLSKLYTINAEDEDNDIKIKKDNIEKVKKNNGMCMTFNNIFSDINMVYTLQEDNIQNVIGSVEFRKYSFVNINELMKYYVTIKNFTQFHDDVLEHFKTYYN